MKPQSCLQRTKPKPPQTNKVLGKLAQRIKKSEAHFEAMACRKQINAFDSRPEELEKKVDTDMVYGRKMNVL